MTIAPHQHPVLACVSGLHSLLNDVTAVDPSYMRTSEKEAALRALAQVAARVDGLRMRVMSVAGDVAADEGAKDVAAWVGAHLNVDRGAARRELRLAHALDVRWAQVREAIDRGDLSVAQAEVIVQALEALPGDVVPEVRIDAERHLVEQAAGFGPRELRILGRRVLDVVAPEIGEEHERKLLEAEERCAHQKVRCSSRRRGDGTTAVNSVLPDPVADRLMAYLHAYTSPRRHGASIAVESEENGAAGGRRCGRAGRFVGPPALPGAARAGAVCAAGASRSDALPDPRR